MEKGWIRRVRPAVNLGGGEGPKPMVRGDVLAAEATRLAKQFANEGELDDFLKKYYKSDDAEELSEMVREIWKKK